MQKILLHPRTKASVDTFLTKPAHALLLIGEEGSGKTYLARAIAADILHLKAEHLDKHQYFSQMSPSGTSFGIEQVRQLQRIMQLRTTGENAIRRVIILEQCQTMTIEAQNALLKTLEEPPADTLIILTATRKQLLLPTVISRLQHIEIQTPDLATAQVFFGDTSANFQTLYNLSRGRAGLLTALINNDDEHPVRQAIEVAKSVLKQSTYEKLLRVNELSGDKEQLSQFISALKHISLAALVASKEQRRIRQWYNVFRRSHQAEQRLRQSVNTKLVLTDLLLNL